MNKLLTTAMLLTALFSSSLVFGQAFEKGGKYLNLNLGAAQMWHVGGDINTGSYGWTGFAPITGKLGLQMEFGVHKYVGIGFTTGLGFGAGMGRYHGWSNYYSPEINVPIGFIANFHFYQLIADKTEKDIHADKLDIYAGLNIGSGVAVLLPAGGGTYTSALFFVGPQVGVRYFFNDKVGINAEVGYGKSLINGGVVFKL